MRFLLFGRFFHRDRGKSQSISRRIGPVSHRSFWTVTFPRFTIRSSISAEEQDKFIAGLELGATSVADLIPPMNQLVLLLSR